MDRIISIQLKEYLEPARPAKRPKAQESRADGDPMKEDHEESTHEDCREPKGQVVFHCNRREYNEFCTLHLLQKILRKALKAS